MKRCVGPAVIVFGSLVAGVLLAEGLVAIVNPQPVLIRRFAENPAMHVSDPIVVHTLRPDYFGAFVRPEFDTRVSINSRGFRGPEFLHGGKPRIVALGDSFTFGHGVQDEETYPALLEALIEDVEVVNGGYVAGSSPDMYYASLKDGVLDELVDGLLIGFFIGNDIDGHRQWVWQEVDSIGLPTKFANTSGSYVVNHRLQKRPTRPIRYRYPVLRNSHLFQLAATVIRQLKVRLEEPPSATPSVFDDNWSEATRAEVERTQDVFDGIFSWASGLGLPVAVVMIPTLQQVMGDAPLRAQEVFSSFFDERGIPSLDLLPSLTGQPDAYFASDQHWTALGHRIAARELRKWYPESGLPRAR